jgi:hypothetical protein
VMPILPETPKVELVQVMLPLAVAEDVLWLVLEVSLVVGVPLVSVVVVAVDSLVVVLLFEPPPQLIINIRQIKLENKIVKKFGRIIVKVSNFYICYKIRL